MDETRREPEFDPFADDWAAGEPESAAVETEAAESGAGRNAGAQDEGARAGVGHDEGARDAGSRDEGVRDEGAGDGPGTGASSGSVREGVEELDSTTASRAPAGDRAGPGVVASWQGRITTPEQGRAAIDALLEHRARRRGRVIGLAGLPGHGKSDFARRLRIKSVERPGVDLRYDKTETGEVNIYYVPGRHEHHALIDMAGEDFRSLGRYDEPIPRLMRDFLWPVLQELDGLILMMALPLIWQHYNAVDRPDRVPVDVEGVRRMRRAQDDMVDAHLMLLKYAAVAQDLRRLRRRFPELNRDEAPDRELVDNAFQAARKLRAPVVLALSKADLYESHGERRALHTPDLPMYAVEAPPLHPRASDPLMVGWVHFRRLFEFLGRNVRHFKFEFVQVLEDPSDNPLKAVVEDPGIETLIGVESLVDFIARHPWPMRFGISAGTALRIDRLLRRDYWNNPIRALDGRQA